MNTISSECKMKTKKVKTINKVLKINGGDLDLYLDLYLTDNKTGIKEHILTKKADSILANFLRIMYLQMGRDVRDNVMGGTFYYLFANVTALATSSPRITNISAGVGNKVRVSFNTSVLSGNPTGKISLGGFQGVSIDGLYTFTRISDSILDLEGTTYGAGWTAGTGGVSIYLPITKLGYPSYKSFASYGIVVGTGTTAVAIGDDLLEKQIPSIAANGGLTYNTSTVSMDTNDSTSAQITFTRTFTNNASLTVGVNEIGLIMQAGTTPYLLLVMRDKLPSVINVAAGKTLTVNYRIKTVLDTGTDPGGFVASFMRLLYRQAGQAQRAVFDIDNVSRTYYPDPTTFIATNSGGFVTNYATGGSEIDVGWRFGINVGTGDNAVAMGDYNLETVIQHGNTTGKMLYYGGFAENFVVGVDYAQFDLIRAIENDSGGSIIVSEYSLNVGSDNSTSISDTNPYAKYIYMVTRNVLTSPVTVDDGEILKVVYSVRCEVPVGES